AIFVSRGVALALLALTVLILFMPTVRLVYGRLRRRSAPPAPATAPNGPAPAAAATIRARLAALAVPAIVLIGAAGMLLWSYEYDGRTRMVPAIVAWVLLVFGALDLLAATGTRVGDWIRAFFTGSLAGPDAGDDTPQPLPKILKACA